MLNDQIAAVATKTLLRLVALIIVASTIVGHSLVTTISASSADKDINYDVLSANSNEIDSDALSVEKLTVSTSEKNTLAYIPAVGEITPPTATGTIFSGTELIDHAANNTQGKIQAPSHPNSDTAAKATEDATKAADDAFAEEDFIYVPEIPLSKDLQQHTYQRCLEKGLTYTVVLALMWRESRFDTGAVGYNTNGTLDHGVMQINDVNKGWLSRELGVNNLMDPVQNINAGTEMLGRMNEKYGMHNALMAYQYGEQGMLNKVRQGVTTNRQVEQLYAKSSEFDQMVTSYRPTVDVA